MFADLFCNVVVFRTKSGGRYSPVKIGRLPRESVELARMLLYTDEMYKLQNVAFELQLLKINRTLSHTHTEALRQSLISFDYLS